jgi:hypothetical protein
MIQLRNFLSPPPVFAAPWTVANNCVNADGVAKIQGFNCIFENIAQVIVYFAGLVFLMMFIKGGFSYLTSGGDPKKTAKATSTLTLSVIGLVGVIISFLVIKFINDFTGVNVTEFTVPTSITIP